ncbi:MAG: molybdopterin molybdotransferase MoeA [Burkholderiaceae bacterium]|jgi:molybdopterin molybdotransferase|nr:molybdopterin molybdotransferase MoeA [Burkholderiaceae bacterium]
MPDTIRRLPLIPLDEALRRLLGRAEPLTETEVVSTFDADGRVLAQPVVSEVLVPPHDNSSMDGYAVRAATVIAPGVEMAVSQRIPAGRIGEPLAPGSAARIFTGAPMPVGADAVVAQEDTEPLGDGARVRINVVPASGQWVRKAGEDVMRGTVVLRRGERLSPASLGLAAGIGVAELKVTRRPRVALFSTGDELVMPGAIRPTQMPPGAIYNSNRFFLAALLRRMGCEVQDYGSVPDRRNATLLALRAAAREHDLILTSGGISVGEEDHVKPVVEQMGTLDLWQIAMKPGKPFAYGRIARSGGAAHFMGLPGNPVSSFVTFLLLVRPFLLKLQGASRLDVPALTLRADFDWPKPGQRREFLRARRNTTGGVELFANQSSGVLTSVYWADGLIDHPAGRGIARGDTVRFLPIVELLT